MIWLGGIWLRFRRASETHTALRYTFPVTIQHLRMWNDHWKRMAAKAATKRG